MGDYKKRLVAGLLAATMVLSPAVSTATKTDETKKEDTKVEETVKETETQKIAVERISGKNRTATSLKVAEKLTKGETAFLTSGVKLPDALSVGTIASGEKAPIILSNSQKEVYDEMKKMDIKDVVIVGGEGTVSKEEESKLKEEFTKENVSRISGKNRYETSKKLLKEYKVKEVGVVGGTALADALTANPYLYKNEYGVLLIQKDGELPKDLTAKVTIGGKASVTEDFGDERISGKDRYETASAIAEKYGEYETVVIASGSNFADALSAAPLAAELNAPVLLTNGENISENTLKAIKKAKKAVIIGGEASVPSAIIEKIGGEIEEDKDFDKENIKEMSISKKPKTEYFQREELSFEGIELELKDKKENERTIGKDKFEEYKIESNIKEGTILEDAEKSKDIEFKIKDTEIKTNYNIKVKEVYLSDFKVIGELENSKFEGEDIERLEQLKGLKLQLIHNDGSTIERDILEQVGTGEDAKSILDFYGITAELNDKKDKIVFILVNEETGEEGKNIGEFKVEFVEKTEK